MNDPKTWDRNANDYLQFMAKTRITTAFAEESFDIVMKKTPVSHSLKILDVAAGTGALSLYAAKKTMNDAGFVLATDFSEGMLQVIQKESNRLQLTNVETKVMDGMNLQIKDNTFDLGFSSFGIFLFPDPLKGLQELYRVVKPGGKVGITSFAITSAMPKLFQFVFSKLPVPQNPTHHTIASAFLNFGSKDGVEEGFKRAGFVDVEVTMSSYTSHVESYSFFIESNQSSPGYLSMKQKLGSDNAKLYDDTFAACVKELYPTEPFQLVNVALIATGTKPITDK